MNVGRRGFIAGIAACFAAVRVGMPVAVAAPVAASLTCMADILKTYYSADAIDAWLWRDNPMTALLPRAGWEVEP